MNVRKRDPAPPRGTFKNAATQPMGAVTQAKGIPNAVSKPMPVTTGCVKNAMTERGSKKGKRG